MLADPSCSACKAGTGLREGAQRQQGPRHAHAAHSFPFPFRCPLQGRFQDWCATADLDDLTADSADAGCLDGFGDGASESFRADGLPSAASDCQFVDAHRVGCGRPRSPPQARWTWLPGHADSAGTLWRIALWLAAADHRVSGLSWRLWRRNLLLARPQALLVGAASLPCCPPGRCSGTAQPIAAGADAGPSVRPCPQPSAWEPWEMLRWGPVHWPLPLRALWARRSAENWP